MTILDPVEALEIMTAWLQDNVNMESDIIFDNDEDRTDSEVMLPALLMALNTLKTIASLRESHSQIIQSRDHYKKMAEDGIRLLSSKVLSIKLTDCDFGAVQHISGGSTDYCNGFVDGTQNAVRAVTSACTANGIKFRIEEK
ncbi:hypothetical protein MPI44_004568 [Klebsiella oxytoca]|nr:hypothetical protein [Klebsiella oxytoca]